MRLSNLIKQEVESFKQEQQITNYAGKGNTKAGIKFDHYDIIHRINLYMNDEFYDDVPSGAIFWNLGRTRSVHFAKKIDSDTKDYKIQPQGDNNSYQGWIINVRFQRWARESGFALDLNDLSEGLADYGSLIMKLIETKNGYKLKECDFMKLFFDTTVETLEGQTVIELHELSEEQIRAHEGGWDNIEDAIKNAEKVPGTERDGIRPKYQIWERIGWFTEEGKPARFMRTVSCGEGDKEVVLYEKVIKPEDSPYYDFHISKYRGRFLRVGVYERLFNLQERINTLVNENAQTSAIASLLLMRSTDPRLKGHNVLHEAISGMILDTNDLEQVGIDNRALNAFLQEMSLIEMQADRLCMTSDFITGDEVPKGLTFRGQAALTNVAASSFKNARDRVCTQVSKILLDKILPREVQNWNREDVFEIAENDQDIRKYDEIALKIKVDEFIRNNPDINMDMIGQFKKDFIQQLDMYGRRIVDMKNFFNFKFGFIINASGENVNKEQKNEVYYNAITMKQSDPRLANDPLYRQYLEDNGIPAFKISEDEVQQAIQEKQMMGQTAQPQGQPKQPDKLMSQINE